jgi:type IV fimbrial biogenesis protein FimT
MLNRRRSQRGFTLIEVMISLTVLGILLMIALPSFSEWLQNQQLRAASEATLNGLQAARGAAIRRNVLVQFRQSAPPTTAWSVTEVGTGTVVQSRAHEEGSPNAVITATPAGATTVTFTSLGSVVVDPARVTQFDVSNPAGGSCQPGGPMRCLRVTISGGGSLRMCDPIVGVTDPRSC